MSTQIDVNQLVSAEYLRHIMLDFQQMSEFVENPFSEPFRKVEEAVRTQQSYETPLVKSMVTKLPDFKKLVPEESEAIDKIADSAIRRDKALIAASRSTVTPVKHTIVIEPVK